MEWWCRQGKPKIRSGSNRKRPKCVKLPKLRFVCFVPCLPTKREVRAGLGGLVGVGWLFGLVKKEHKTLMSAEKKDVKYNFGKDG